MYEKHNLILTTLFFLQPVANKDKKPREKKVKESKDKTKNIMRDLHIRKLCLNICVGESGDRLTRAAKVSLKTIVSQVFYIG